MRFPPPESVAINQRVLELKSEGVDVLSLASGELAAFAPNLSLDPSDLLRGARYSDSRGISELRCRIAQEYPNAIDPDSQVVISAGSKLLFYMILSSICEPGDEVVLFEPAWLSYQVLAKLAGARVVSVPYQKDTADFRKYIGKQTRLLIVNNPNNPAGKLYSKEEMEALLELSLRFDFTILADEAYSSFDKCFVSFVELDPQFERTIVLNSFSKNFALSGWRLGYAVGSKDAIQGVLLFNQHLLTCASSQHQIYIARHFEALKDYMAPVLRELCEKRKQVSEYAQSLGFEIVPGSTTPYLMLSIAPSKMSSDEFSRVLLEEKQVAVVPGKAYGESCDGFVRISIGMESLERIVEGLQRIRCLAGCSGDLVE